MLEAIPREPSLGYWPRIKSTLLIHHRYAMKSIHREIYHSDTYITPIPHGTALPHTMGIRRMLEAIPREPSLGYWLRIKSTLLIHHRYAMKSIHREIYHSDTYIAPIPHGTALPHTMGIRRMLEAIPREPSLGYWLRIKSTLLIHHRYAMKSIHPRIYHSDTYITSMPYLVILPHRDICSKLFLENHHWDTD